MDYITNLTSDPDLHKFLWGLLIRLFVLDLGLGTLCIPFRYFGRDTGNDEGLMEQWFLFFIACGIVIIIFAIYLFFTPW